MTPDELKERAIRFAISVARLCRQLGDTPQGEMVGRQLFRAATGIASNYRASCRSRSRAEFSARLAVAVEEADESVFWLQFLLRAEIRSDDRVRDLLQEATGLRAILAASHKTVKRNLALLKEKAGRKIPTITR